MSEVTQILKTHNGKLADPGSVKWMFERKGVLSIPLVGSLSKEDLELKVIEAGAEDICWHEKKENSEKKFIKCLKKLILTKKLILLKLL